MKTEKITAEQAAKYFQTKRFGVISEGCTGIWGEGDTKDEAIEDALNALSTSDDGDIWDGCWIQELATIDQE